MMSLLKKVNFLYSSQLLILFFIVIYTCMYTVDLSAKFKQWVQSRAEATATMKTESTTSKERASVILDIQNTVISQIGLWGAYQEHTKELRDKEKTEKKNKYKEPRSVVRSGIRKVKYDRVCA